MNWLEKLKAKFGGAAALSPVEALDEADRGRTVVREPVKDLPLADRSAEAPQAASFSPEPADDSWKVGDVVLDTYEVKQIHDGGGMGLVYRVHHRGWNTDLAVKSPRREYFQTQTDKDNFTHECETWINLGLHPHIVSCYYVLAVDGIPRVFAEYVEGGSLHDWIRSRRLYEGGPQEASKRILDIAIQMAWGLQYAHEQDLVHQDVKPANVMMMPDGTAKITDFGLAKARAAGGQSVVLTAGRTVLVSSGGMTPAYCSPEQARFEPLSRKADIWSWAVSVLEMFTGEVRWQSGIAAPEVLKHLDEVRVAGAGIPEAPADLLQLLDHCFAPEPRGRPENLGIVTERLKNIYRRVFGDEYVRELPEGGKLHADALNNRALSLLDLGKGVEAEKTFNEALKAEPSHLEANYNRGLMLWRLGKITDDALVQQLEDVKTQRADDWRAGWLIGVVHIERRDAESAVALLEDSAAIKANDSGVSAALAKAKSGLGHWPRCLRSIEEHTGEVTSVSLSADGRYACSGGGSYDETLRVWELSTGRCLRAFQAHADSIWSVALSSDGRCAVSGGRDEAVRVWELSTGRCLRTFKGHTNMVIAVALSSDGRCVLSGGQDGTVRLWELSTGLCLRTFDGHQGWVKTVALSTDGRWVLSGGGDQQLRLWELSTGRCLQIFQGHTDDIASVAFSADGRCALSGSDDKTVRLWELSTGRCLRTFEGHTAGVFSVVLSADGRWALSGSVDATLRLWELSTGRCLRTFHGHTSWVRSVALSIDGRWALSGSRDKTLRLWDLRPAFLEGSGAFQAASLLSRVTTSEAAVRSDREFAALMEGSKTAASRGDWGLVLGMVAEARNLPQHEKTPDALMMKARAGLVSRRRGLVAAWCPRILQGHANGVGSVVLSADGSWALSGSYDRTLRLWDSPTGSCLRTFEGHTDSVVAVALSADGRWGLSGSFDRKLRLWELSTGRCVRTVDGDMSFVLAVAISTDGRWALAGSAAMSKIVTLRLFDLSTGRCAQTFGEKNPITSVALSHDGQWALSASRDGPLLLWELSTGRCLRTFRGNTGSVVSVALSTDGRWALSGSDDKTLRLWELSSGSCLRTFEGHTDKVTSVAISADGRWALSGSDDKTLRLWELSSGSCLRAFEGHTDEVTSVAFSADGRWVLSSGRLNSFRLWELDWDYEFPGWADWDEGARPHLETFLTLHTPYVSINPDHPEFLLRRGPATWNHEEWLSLLRTLQHAGYGWLRADGVGRELEKMTATWQGPQLMLREQGA